MIVKTCLLVLLLGRAVWAESIVMTAGETKLTINREPLRVGLEHRDSPTVASVRRSGSAPQLPLPPGKTPLFVGASGIVVEKRGSSLVARVCPVTGQAEMFFIHPDGVSSSSSNQVEATGSIDAVGLGNSQLSFSIVNDHRKIGFEVFGDTLRPVVERHIEQPVAANIKLHKPASG
jgi:hypothetical protein